MISLSICMYVSVSVYACQFVRICDSVYLSISVHVCLSVYMSVCQFVCMCPEQGYLWMVPLSVSTSSSPQNAVHRSLLSEHSESVTIDDVKSSDWLKVSHLDPNSKCRDWLKVSKCNPGSNTTISLLFG